MGLWDKMREPVFLKESSDAQRQIQMLDGLAPYLTLEGQEILRQDIRFLEYGILGERQIAYELKNSHMPMYILHDIYLEDGNLSAQIDYIVVTRKLCFIIECKNLYGNMEITPSGAFYRIMNVGGQRRMEAIYSPITQNEHHLELLKKIRLDEKGNFLFRKMAEKQFDRCYQSVVVLANPKTMVYARDAVPSVREKVIRADQLVAYIRKKYQESTESELSDKKLREWAKSFLELHQEKQKNYLYKYQPYLLSDYAGGNEKKQDSNNAAVGRKRTRSGPETGRDAERKKETRYYAGTGRGKIPKESRPAESGRIEDTPIFKALRVYRWKKSQEEEIKPYFIYNDNQLKDLIAKMPRNTRELCQVDGFGEVKAKKYGPEILKILEQFRDR